MTAISRLKRCPCNSKLGSLIIGYFSMMQAVIGTTVILFGFSLYVYDQMYNGFSDVTGEKRSEPFSDLMLTLLLVALVLNVFHIFVSSLLLRGVRKGKQCLLLPWLISMLLGISLFVAGLASCVMHEYYHPILLAVFVTLALADSCCVIVVASHYFTLKTNSRKWSGSGLTMPIPSQGI